MLTLCWSAKGGSGTTSVVAALALSSSRPTLLVDLAGELAAVLGMPSTDAPQLPDWFDSSAAVDRLEHLERTVRPPVSLLSSDERIDRGGTERWRELASHLRTVAASREVIVDAGTGPPPAEIMVVADRSLLITRPCYLALTRAKRMTNRPTGVVLIDEPGRSIGAHDIEAALGAPVVATLLVDPKIARAVDSGLMVSRLPSACLNELRAAS